VSICIGIDPGKITGLAIYDRESKSLVKLASTNFWDCYGYILTTYPDIDEVHSIVIEVPETKKTWSLDSRLRRLSYQDRNKFLTEAAVAMKISHDVGRVCRESELLADGLEKAGYTVLTHHPTGKGKQLDKFSFKRITGWPKVTNEHTRDAAMMVWGM